MCAIGKGGKLALPGFIRTTLSRRSDAGVILAAVHETDPCLVGYDPAFARELAADCRRRRLAEEASAPHAHHARARLLFGFVEEARVDGSGRVTLPRMMLRRAGIGERALVIGAGGTFEVWNPQVALESGDPDLRELAALSLEFQQAA